MNTQPEALRLADALEMSSNHGIRREAAAELRRLYEENERCREVCKATSECWRADAEKWKDQRDALLEALKGIVAMWDHHCCAHGDGQPTPLHVKARAAIARAEEKA